MPGSCLTDLHTAVWGILSSDPILQNAFNGIYDGSADPDAEYPYIVMGEWTEIPSDLLVRVGREATVLIHTWSNYKGFKEVHFGANHLIKLLSRQMFTMTDWALIYCTVESNDVMMGEAELRHGLTRFRFKVQPK